MRQTPLDSTRPDFGSYPELAWVAHPTSQNDSKDYQRIRLTNPNSLFIDVLTNVKSGEAMAKRHHSRTDNLQSVFMRLEELVLANSGQDEFQEIFKLTIAKLYDEKFSKEPLFRTDGDIQQTFERIKTLLRKAEVKWPGVLLPLPTINLAPEHLDICINELQRHTIGDNSLQALDEFFEFIVSKSMKGNKGQYFTPRHLIEMCVRMVNPQADEIVADPACGSGGFLMHALHHMKRDGHTVGDLKSNLWGFDMDERATSIARSLLIISGINSPNVFRLNSLSVESRHDLFINPENLLTIEKATHSKTRNNGIFDVILTNPPFAGEIQERSILQKYDLSQNRNRVERDILFIERCIHLLKPGGRMAIVLPHNKLSSAVFTYVRQWMLKRCHIAAVVGIGRNMFMPHTQQKTGIVFLQKKRSEDERSLPIFFAMSEKEGKDSRGNHVRIASDLGDAPLWKRLDHDLEPIATGFQELHAWGR
ncbi:MAG: class I SAM-dependent DNA methyltransferase [Rhodospirillaceae bacterium]